MDQFEKAKTAKNEFHHTDEAIAIV